MRFRIADAEYDAATIEDITLRDTLVFERQMADLGRPMSWPDMMRMIVRLAAIPDPSTRGEDPDAMWSLAVTIWASKRLAGEDVTVAEATDFRLSDLVFLPDPVTESPTKAGANPAPADDEPSESTPS